MMEGYQGIRNKSAPHYDINCWNNSKTFNNRSYHVTRHCITRCLSGYRIRDGLDDCMIPDESFTNNSSCSQIQRHRLRCSSSELSCLLADALGNWGLSCFNARDEVDPVDGTILRGNVFCSKRNDPACIYLRNYIRMSSQDDEDGKITAENPIVDARSALVIPFRWYCDSFFNDRSGNDELPEFCKQWICSTDEYQCLSGQCILQSWVCDGEWDCSDGSDEQRLFIMDSFSEHNSRLMDLTMVKETCHQRYLLSTPFSDLCNISTEYPCFRTDAADPFDVRRHRPCIDLEQTGDGQIDCLSGLDERNRMQCSDKGMLGFHLQYRDDECLEYFRLCSTEHFWTGGVNTAYDSVCFYVRNRLKDGTVTNCNYQNDVLCLNDVCMRNARCNGWMECPHGEDEYRCIPQGASPYDYRMDKKTKPFQKMKLQNYPSSTGKPFEDLDKSNRNLSLPTEKQNRSSFFATDFQSPDDPPLIYEKRHANIKSVYKMIRDALPPATITFENHYLPFICNHGIAVKYYTGHVICLCSPSYFGPQCEFYSDRMTILTHLDLTHYRPSSQQVEVIKVLTTLLFEDRIIDYYEFHVHPQLQDENNYVKQMIFSQYPRNDASIQLKRNNRSGTQLYSVRFEAFNLHSNKKIEPIGVWEYPIYFDFLPSFRLSKILRFPSPTTTSLDDPCSSNPCGQNGFCQKMISSHRSSHFCSCHSGFYGDYCQYSDQECNHYCSPTSICKPTYRRLVTSDQHPLCICPASTFGTSCYLTNNHCRPNPCLHGGTCIVTYNITNTDHYICLCNPRFAGEHCQYPKKKIAIKFTLSTKSRLQADDVMAATVSFNDYLISLLRLDMRHQQVYRDLPSYLELVYDDTFITNAPTLALMKIYQSSYRETEPEYYILYYQIDQKEISITVDLTSENYCPSVQTLWHLLPTNKTIELLTNTTFNSTMAIFSYHRICQAKRSLNTTFSCFRDDNYLCICESDHYRVECFTYNHSIDQCSLCLSNGQCLKGEPNIKTDFLCLCPRCYHGSICQYSTELMSFTVDSLIINDIRKNYLVSCIVYIFIVIFVFLFGFFTNLCGLLTFIRPLPRKVGVGNYLLIVSMLNQCSLLTLLLKIIHIILGSNGTLFHYTNLNLYACKIISYLLSVFTRTTYWLTSFVTIERVCVVLFPTSAAFKHPRLALCISTFSILLVSAMHIHEVLHYTTIVDLSYTSLMATVCVTSYIESLILSYNRVNVLIHHLIPFFIQIVSITVIIIQIAARRRRTHSSRQQNFIDLLKKQFRTHREHYVTPMIIIFSSLPQTILSFLYACTELKQLWQRYALLATIFLSYLPQMLGFILYVLPSKTYSDEFRQTVIGKRLLRQQQRRTRQNNFRC